MYNLRSMNTGFLLTYIWVDVTEWARVSSLGSDVSR